MGITVRECGVEQVSAPGVWEVVVEVPPVNALPAAGWFELAAALRGVGADPDARCVVLRAEGRGFNAGVDIKELQRLGHEALVRVNRGCFEAFAAVYECAVPVVVAVQGYCLGGGIGLVGNADAIVASDDATFGLPEVERGALGAATHLARLVPPLKLRSMVLTAQTASAQELHAYGSILSVVPRDTLRMTALGVAVEIASKPPAVVRAAKECLNGIDPVDPRRSYRYEQGYTYELTLAGEGDRARARFVEGD